MKIAEYGKIKPTSFYNDEMKGVAGRVVIGKSDGADNFCMRVFEIAPEGYTRKHTHDWEHEVFVYCGKGECYSDLQWHPVKAGDAIFVRANEEHQFRNVGKDLFIFVCLIPAKAPEL